MNADINFMESLHKKGVKFVACNNSLTAYNITIRLLADIEEGEKSAREKGWLSADDVEAKG